MQVISNRKKIVESAYPPQDTNVLWVDLSEDKEKKVKSIKEYKNGKWEEMIAADEGRSELDYNRLEDIIQSNIVLLKKIMTYPRYYPSLALGNPDELNFTKIKLFCKINNIGSATIDYVYLDKSSFDKLYTPSVSITFLNPSVYLYNKTGSDSFWDEDYYTILLPTSITKESIVTIKDDSYKECIVLCCLLDNGKYKTLPDWFIEKYKVE